MKMRLTIAAAALLLAGGCNSFPEPDEMQTADSAAETQASEAETTTAVTTQKRQSLMERLFGDYSSEEKDSSSREESSKKSGGSFGGKFQEIPTPTTTTAVTKPPEQTYLLTVDATGLVTRTSLEQDMDLTWVIEVNGRIELERNANGETTYRPMDYGPGTYRIWLKSWPDRVSNIIEFEGPPGLSYDEAYEGPEGFERFRVMECKDHMKHLVQVLRDCYGEPEYKMGFVIDPDHNGICNGITFYAGKGDHGEPVQYIMDNASSEIHFSSADYSSEKEDDSTLCIWCNPDAEMDYIVLIKPDGTCIDCCTGDVLKNLNPDKAEYLYLFTADTPTDRDHFYVSYHGCPRFEGA